jgi:hypothetical protein
MKMSDAQSILKAAAELPERERVRVLEELLETLEPTSPSPPEEVQRSWRNEILRRSEELRSGGVQPIAWSEVRLEGERLLDDKD